MTDPLRGAATAFALLGMLAGCSTTPRAYAPVNTIAPADQAAFAAAFERCSADVQTGRTSNFREGRGRSVAGGAAIGAAAGVGAAAAVVPGTGMLGGVAAGAGLATGFILVAPIAIIGMTAAKRARNERVVREAMTACLAEDGFTGTEWRLASRSDTGPTSPTSRPPRR
jgi:hypothetical protein